MNPQKFSDWKSSVREMNKTVETIDKNRAEVYKWLADEVRTLFEDCEMFVENLHFNNNGSVIQVRLEDTTSKSIKFPKHFIDNIGMPFSVQRVLNCDGLDVVSELFVELYPLEED